MTYFPTWSRADSTAGQRLDQRPVATASATPYQSVLSPCHCSALTPASHSDISRVKVRTSSAHADANKWHLNVTLGPEAKTMRWKNMASARFPTRILFECDNNSAWKVSLWNNVIHQRLTKLRPKQCNEDGENKPLNPLSADEGNYTAAALKHLISSLCTIVLYHIFHHFSTIALNASSSLQ